MCKKNFFKVAAMMACLGILLLSVPGTYAMDKKASKFDYKLLIKKPAMFFSSLLSFIPIFDTGKATVSTDNTQDNYGKKIKITGGLVQGKPSDGD